MDYAFKRLFGEERNKNLLLHFLNAVLRPSPPLASLTLLDPTLGRRFMDDKLSVVDVLAVDQRGRHLQVEVQLAPHRGLRRRMLFNWSTLYTRQLEQGQSYEALCPVLSLWLLGARSFPGPEAHRRFRALDEQGRALTDDLALHVLELSKFELDLDALDEEASWVYFLRDSHRWTSLPSVLDTPEMRQAMGTLHEISEQELEWLRYRRRLDAMRVEQAKEARWRETEVIRAEVEAMQANAEATLAEVEASRAEVEATRAEVEATRAEVEASRAEVEASRTEVEASRTEVEAMQAEAEATRAEVEASRTEVEASLAKVEASRTEVEAKQAEAEAKQAEAEVLLQKNEEARQQLEQERQTLELERRAIEQLRARLRALETSDDR
ncbi:MAG: Rpn family recombination-promoting nuclease/putative transposase [Alphaproteobacteria bacterium]|nr:Rpn family recombination-promoting nuclease/putative transposase [Alphaproteobacteria bacterium]